jgi:hypothetical protein
MCSICVGVIVCCFAGKSKGNFLDFRCLLRKYTRGVDVLCFVDMKGDGECWIDWRMNDFIEGYTIEVDRIKVLFYNNFILIIQIF